MKDLMEGLLRDLKSHEAQGDLIFSTSKSLKMSAQKGSISEYKVSSAQILGLRAIKDGRVGISYSESLDKESLKVLVKQALDNALVSEKNLTETILEDSGEISDEADYPEAPVDISFKVQKTLELESGVKKLDPRVVAVPYNYYTESEYSSLYLNSQGRVGTYKDKSYSIVTTALMDDHGKKANFDDFHISHTFSDLEWERVAQTAYEYARDILTEKGLPTGKYHVKFDVDCLKSLLDCFSNFYSAKSIIDKVNPWSEKLGEVVTSKDLSIEDQPLYKNSFRISKFDSEGVLRKPLTLIEDGVLKSFYHNSATAKHFKAKTTGHASRGPSSSLNVSGTDLIIHGKNVKPMPPKYLEIIQMDGLYSGANRVTGFFSVGVKGYLWENGEKVMTFGNCTLSGNLLELLKNVEVTGLDLVSSSDRSFFSVPLIFHDLSIAGL